MAAAGTIVGIGALLGEFPSRSTLPLDLWLAWLAPMIVLVLLQVASEEIVFRGYVMQQLAARFRSPLIWVGVPAAVFTVLHAGAAPTPELSLAILAIVFTFALTAAALVWLTGSLWAAIGAHAGHNLPLLLFFGAAGDPLGGALWEYPRPESLADVYLTGAVELAVLVYVLSPLSPFRRPPR
jgi:membrane protease YdiL (CAAX protease family)